MNPKMDFVDPHATVFQREAELEIEDTTVPVAFAFSEEGQIDMQVLDRPDKILTDGLYEQVEGTTDRGEKVIARDVFCVDKLSVTLSPQIIEVIGDENRTVRGEEVTVNAGVLGFQYKYSPKQFKPDDALELISRSGTRAGGGNTVDWSMVMKPLSDYSTRVYSIRNYHNLVRTVEIDTTLEGLYGNLPRVAEFATDRVQEICWLSSFIQGTLPASSKIEFKKSGDDSDSQSSTTQYVKLTSLHDNIGSSCCSSYLLFRSRHEISSYLDRTYETFLEKESAIQLKKVLGLYVDSLNSRRPVEPRYVNLCMAMEMLANRFSADQGSTANQIQKLVKDLGIEFKDLISFRGSFPTKYHPTLYQEYRSHVMEHGHSIPPHIWGTQDRLPAPQEKTLEYFWYNSRNNAVHGDPQIPEGELMEDQHSLIVLFQRLLREILLEGDLEGLRGLQTFDRRELTRF